MTFDHQEPTMSPLDLLDESQSILTTVIAGAADSLDSPTPCSDYDVRKVINHTLLTIESFTAPLDGGRTASFPEIIAAADRAESDVVADTKAVLERSHSAWAGVGDLEAPVNTNLGPVPGGVSISVITFQNVVHAWDIAKATGQAIAPSDALMDVCEGTAAAVLPIVPEGFFAPSTSGGGTRVDRLAALTGRSV
jgi:uncharacterized protein (TIGR03086 family)